jgi:hypothetical protein
MARSKDPRAARRNLLIRQTVIYSLTIAGLVVVGVASWGMFNGKMTPWFDSDFSSAPTPSVDTGPQPCPSDNAVYPALSELTVNVQNGNNRPGAAATAAQSLGAVGIKTATANANRPFEGAIKIVSGIAGVDRAYAILAVLPAGTRLAMDNREADTIDIVLGQTAPALGDLTQVKYDVGTVIERPPGCVAPDKIAAGLTKPSPPAAPAPATEQ